MTLAKILWILPPGLLGLALALPGPVDGEQGEKLFALHVKDILAEKCSACHSRDKDKKFKGGLDLSTRALLLEGGKHGAVLIPGRSKESRLYIATTWKDEDLEMPPKQADRLTEMQQWKIRDWIDAGAPWPDDARVAELRAEFATGEIVQTSGGLSADWTNRRYESEKLWAYRPLNVTPVPQGEHPVDWFIGKKLQEIGLAPAPVAAPRELARRLSFGLTGLPPLPADAQDFEAAYEDDPAAAVREYSDELMASPHYGEHFGRQWLDVTRYADSAGFANDFTRPNAWRYRDYVVRAFNADKPYDQFVREQVAGDELQASDSETLIATGFLRMGPWEQTGMSVFRLTRQQWLDDVTDSVGQTFLAHAMQCAKCHDHKFDPIPTRDYYSMLAVFTTTQFAERPASFLEEENLTGFAEATRWIEAKQGYYRQQKESLEERIAQRRKAETADARTGDNNLDPGDEASLSRLKKNLVRHVWELDKTRPIALAVYTGKTIKRKNFQSRTFMPKGPWEKGTLEQDTILTGGDAFTRGAEVTPAALSVAESLGGMQAASFPSGTGKRRLAFAEWIVDRQNPLTARVLVNRVWSWHFGKGIAGNPNNFGGTGALPTHAHMLDYLADWFMKNGWSVKKLNAMILSSAAYRRSSRHPSPTVLEKLDPKHSCYAIQNPRRLTAEELRDAMLAASGELNLQLGGIPARPDINMEVAMQPRHIMGGTASVYEPDPLPAQRNRRSLYAEKIRGLRDPFLEAFNQPGTDKSCEMRETSTVAPQALTLFNAEEVQDRSLAFAARLLAEGLDDRTTLERAFEIALGRGATAQELEMCASHWKDATSEETGKIYAAVEFPRAIKRTVMAEKSGEPYDFVEYMPAYETYVPDLQRSAVDARTRGLAHICLVLFNLNEFAYID